MRAFVALELPPAVRASVARAQAALREMAPSADVRWTAHEAFHLTLAFLGNVDEALLPALRDALAGAAAASAPFPLATGAPGAFPTPRRARVVWVGLATGAGDVARLAAAVAGAVAPLGFPPEARPFHAHLTLGRVRSPRGLGPLAAALADARPEPSPVWTASEVALFRSHTKPTGAVYEPLARVPLGART